MQRGMDESGSLQIRLMIADDMMLIREYLSMVLSYEQDIKVIDAVGTGAKAVDRALAIHPDILLIDLEMETPEAGVEAIHTLANMDSNIRCVVLTHFTDDDMVFAAFEAGAIDYIRKDSSTAEILETVRAAAHNNSPIRPLVARMIQAKPRALRSERNALIASLHIVFQLSPKELEILRLLIKRNDENEIAKLQNVDSFIIRTYVERILRKFDESSVNDMINRLDKLEISEVFTK